MPQLASKCILLFLQTKRSLALWIGQGLTLMPLQQLFEQDA